MRSIVSLRGICSLGSGRHRSLSSSMRSAVQRPTHRTAAHDGPQLRPMIGSIQDAPVGWENNLDVIELARFAVAEHNTKANVVVEFGRLVKVRQQLVAGRMHYFTIEVKEGGAKKLYEAKAWVKSWENFKGLGEFKRAD